jgi:hypothetical protein
MLAGVALTTGIFAIASKKGFRPFNSSDSSMNYPIRIAPPRTKPDENHFCNSSAAIARQFITQLIDLFS